MEAVPGARVPKISVAIFGVKIDVVCNRKDGFQMSM